MDLSTHIQLSSFQIHNNDTLFEKELNIPISAKIKVVIFEDHNTALKHIYRGIGSKKIPAHNIKLLHFDAHPDMGVPDIPASFIKTEPYEMLNSLGIENWILPAVFSGYIDQVVWLHPPWSNQMTDRLTTNYLTGRCKSTDRIGVNIPEPYFYNECYFAHENDMDDCFEFSLTVSTLHESNTSCKLCNDITGKLLNSKFIVDIDLDTFSTLDPFLDKYTKEQFEMIDRLYTPPRLPELQFPPASLTSTVPRCPRTRDPNAPLPAAAIFESVSLAAKAVCEIHRSHLDSLWRCMRTLAQGRPVAVPSAQLKAETEDCLEASELLELTRLLLSVQEQRKHFSSRVVKAIESTKEAAELIVGALECSHVGKAKVPRVEVKKDLPELDKISHLRLSPDGNSYKKVADVDSTGRHTHPGCGDVFRGNTKETGMKYCSDVDGTEMAYLHDLWKSLADRENFPLPHHVSTAQERVELMESLEGLLNRLHNPSLITIARSVEDGYTPRHEASEILREVFEALKRIYGAALLTVVMDYDSPEDFEMLVSIGLEVKKSGDEVYEGVRGASNVSECLPAHCGESSGDYRTEPDTRDIA